MPGFVSQKANIDHSVLDEIGKNQKSGKPTEKLHVS